ncbi:MAG: hypothetical protein R3F20_05500 [Planctomycetota bacterium]
MKPQASTVAWLLLFIANAIIGMCMWPLWLGLPIWIVGWFLDAFVQAAKSPRCTVCGTALNSGAAMRLPPPEVLEAQRHASNERAAEAQAARDAERKRLAELEARGIDTRSPFMQWAFPRKKRRRRM